MKGLALVTGGTGFIGRYLVRRLVEAGTPVRVLARCPDRVPRELRGSLEIVTGDIRDSAAVERAVSGVTTVFHLAACAQVWSSDPREFAHVNVRAVESLLEHAAGHCVERLVHVSTILTLPPYRAAPGNGRSPSQTVYEATKSAGERLVEAYAARGHHAVIVHPTRVYGPGPLHDANAVTKAISLYLKGWLRLRLADRDALGSYVHADDVANGIMLASRYGRSGAHYVLGGENTSFRGFLELVAEMTGVHRRVLALPPGIGMAIGRAAELWGRLGGRVPITQGWVRTLLEDRRVTLDREREDLCYAPRSLRAGLATTLRWLANGQRPST